jgi:hypothetical protein
MALENSEVSRNSEVPGSWLVAVAVMTSPTETAWEGPKVKERLPLRLVFTLLFFYY